MDDIPKIKKEFLEKANLYFSVGCKLPKLSKNLEGESINLYCKICKSIQTFVLNNRFFEGKDINNLSGSRGLVPGVREDIENIGGFLSLDYKCACCKQERAIFVIRIDNNNCEKIGQYPPLDISIPPEIKVLNDKTIEGLYKKAKTSENFSYGIGAFAYYRRIIELKIDELLEKVKEFFPEEKKEQYEKILAKIKKEKNADKKIKIAQKIISEQIIPNNPLKSLYEVLSAGIHTFSDEKCLESASAIRELLILLIKEIEAKKENRKRLQSAQQIIEKLA